MAHAHTRPELRVFIRHPGDIPLEIRPETSVERSEEYLNNVSIGGLAFQSDEAVEEDSLVRVRIPLVKPAFEAVARVVWCREDAGHYDIGVEFLETTDGFRVRMVEQVCQIEHYKKQIQQTEGRALSPREAALEWINKFAESFYSSPCTDREKVEIR